MNFERASGVLLHPTSLPGPYGIGDLGPQAYRWVDFLAQSETGLWQVLPLGPTGYGDSPYQCFSAFAGNPYLISPQLLLQEGLLHSNDLTNLPSFPPQRVDYGKVIAWKTGLLDRAWQRFSQQGATALQAEFTAFRAEHSAWLEDFTLFMALKEAHGGAPWPTWETPIRQRDPDALLATRQDLQTAIERQAFRQFLFFRQWRNLKTYANQHGVRIIGDIPIFVAHDSAEVWARPDLFFIDPYGNPTVVAGVPPDYFSETGQLWGNPLYRWEAHAAEGYRWWLARLQTVLSLVDIIRLDHFRGFAACWEIPAGEATAVNGRWIPGPGAHFFEAVESTLGALPLIAEDLGEITPDVVALREQFHLPGMKILVFAFSDDARNPFLPHNYPQHCVVYTGTHDNDTTVGWYRRAPEKERDYARRYLARDGHDIAWDLIRAAWSSSAVFALAPMQDLLSLDNTARMNYPSRAGGNWQWRMSDDALSDGLCARLREQNQLYGRTPQTRQARIEHLV